MPLFIPGQQFLTELTFFLAKKIKAVRELSYDYSRRIELTC